MRRETSVIEPYSPRPSKARLATFSQWHWCQGKPHKNANIQRSKAIWNKNNTCFFLPQKRRKNLVKTPKLNCKQSFPEFFSCQLFSSQWARRFLRSCNTLFSSLVPLNLLRTWHSSSSSRIRPIGTQRTVPPPRQPAALLKCALFWSRNIFAGAEVLVQSTESLFTTIFWHFWHFSCFVLIWGFVSWKMRRFSLKPDWPALSSVRVQCKISSAVNIIQETRIYNIEEKFTVSASKNLYLFWSGLLKRYKLKIAANLWHILVSLIFGYIICWLGTKYLTRWSWLIGCWNIRCPKVSFIGKSIGREMRVRCKFFCTLIFETFWKFSKLYSFFLSNFSSRFLTSFKNVTSFSNLEILDFTEITKNII